MYKFWSITFLVRYGQELSYGISDTNDYTGNRCVLNTFCQPLHYIKHYVNTFCIKIMLNAGSLWFKCISNSLICNFFIVYTDTELDNLSTFYAPNLFYMSIDDICCTHYIHYLSFCVWCIHGYSASNILEWNRSEAVTSQYLYTYWDTLY